MIGLKDEVRVSKFCRWLNIKSKEEEVKDVVGVFSLDVVRWWCY